MARSRDASRPPLGAFLTGLALTVALGETPAAAAPAWPGGSAPAAVDVLVTELPAEDVWQVSYVFAERVAGVRMARDRRAFRSRAWGVSPAGSTWHQTGEAERLCFPEPARTFAVSFRSDFAKPEKDYEPHVAFSDGGRLLYTGNLLVEPLQRCGPGDGPEAAEPLPGALAHHFRFDTTAGRTVRAGDLAAAGRLRWEPDPRHAETYVFFGDTPVAESERAVLLLDPALPAWIGDDLRALLPRLFDHFAGETAISLPVRPLVFLAYRPEGAGRSFSGGVLDQVVSLALAGEGWREPDPDLRREWFVRLAHEAFHLWGGGVLKADEESEWLSEAAAEAFALRAAVGLGVLPATEHASEVVTLANRCLVELGGSSLLAAPASGSYASWYSCGPVLLFVADRAVEKATPGQGGLGLLYREMFAEGRLAGGVYGTGVFLGWMDKLSGDRPTVHAVQGIVRQGIPRGLDRTLEGLLQNAGLRVALVPPEEATGGTAVYQPLLRTGLVRCACGTTPPQTSSDPDCARFAPGSPLRTVDGLVVSQQPQEAYARLRAAVLMARPLSVVAGDDDQPVSLLCPRDTLDASFSRLLALR